MEYEMTNREKQIAATTAKALAKSKAFGFAL